MTIATDRILGIYCRSDLQSIPIRYREQFTIFTVEIATGSDGGSRKNFESVYDSEVRLLRISVHVTRLHDTVLKRWRVFSRLKAHLFKPESRL